MNILVAGFILAGIAMAWVLIHAFRQNWLWGVVMIPLPFLGIVYAVMNWRECKIPFFLYFAGLLLISSKVFADPLSLMPERNNLRPLCNRVAEASREYQKKYNDWPASSAELLKKGYLTSEETYDTWGSPLKIATYEGKLTVWSLGPDKTNAGTKDNVVFYFDLK